MRQLADALRLERLNLVGHCGGAAAVLSMAARWPDRAERILLISPLAPLHGPKAERYLTPDLRRWRGSTRFAVLGRWAMRSQAIALTRDPEGFLDRLYLGAPEADRAHLADPAYRSHEIASLQEFFALPSRQSLAEHQAIGGPWSLDWLAIRAPTTIEHGEEDRVAPVEMARWLSEQLPNAALRVIPARGHFTPSAEYAHLLRDLIA